ncbi:hypothetical protein BD410DRAFT_67342 [Rickenella mellea]|uniref:Nucleotide-sugar transporter n=1 Tax=Rickenella mellea TaxID=50990 RepID=A0A4Y7QBV5_9AGAM|nr:hypothetical protein BD410DRAFT_67342 [Rickenella mellea]
MHPSHLPTDPSRDMHYRPQPIIRVSSESSFSAPSSRVHLSRTASNCSTRTSTPVASPYASDAETEGSSLRSSFIGGSVSESAPSICGMPLKYVSLVTLAVQNAALSIVMHYSRVSTPPSHSYSPASAVLLNELLKGFISFAVAVMRVRDHNSIPLTSRKSIGMANATPSWISCLRRVNAEIFSRDCWKLSIPAILYVIQNSLQFVAVSNLPVASFQVTYQMKILTTAAFSVALLGKRLSSTKWLSLLFLAIGVGIVQIQTSFVSSHVPESLRSEPARTVGSAHEAAPIHMHVMHPLKGFAAVFAACFTSGLAGVYFEMVLKNSKADLWVRNVQLSLFSIVPALLPIIYTTPRPDSQGIVADLFKNFGGWAWATVAIQVMGGLITAVVIKYSDNIMKGFATSLSIILSFLASVALFHFRITPAFLLGSSTVLAATWMYNQPSRKDIDMSFSEKSSTRFPGSPIGADAPVIGHISEKGDSTHSSPKSIASVLGFAGSEKVGHNEDAFNLGNETRAFLYPLYGSPFPSRSPSPVPPPPRSSPPRSQYPTPPANGEWRL